MGHMVGKRCCVWKQVKVAASNKTRKKSTTRRVALLVVGNAHTMCAGDGWGHIRSCVGAHARAGKLLDGSKPGAPAMVAPPGGLPVRQWSSAENTQGRGKHGLQVTWWYRDMVVSLNGPHQWSTHCGFEASRGGTKWHCGVDGWWKEGTCC